MELIINIILIGVVGGLFWNQASHVGKLEEKILKLEKENREYLDIIYSDEQSR